MKRIRRFLAGLFCRHEHLQFVRNVYGDEINLLGGCRSIWECRKCMWTVYRDDLHVESSVYAIGPDQFGVVDWHVGHRKMKRTKETE